jgi:hypothetical protein
MLQKISRVVCPSFDQPSTPSQFEIILINRVLKETVSQKFMKLKIASNFSPSFDQPSTPAHLEII